MSRSPASARIVAASSGWSAAASSAALDARARRSRASNRAPPAGEEELAEERVVPVPRLLPAEAHREVVPPDELGEDLGRPGLSGERLRRRHAHVRKERRREQEPLGGLRGPVEDLRGEVVEEDLLRGGVGAAAGRERARRRLEEQHRAGHPAAHPGPRRLQVRRRGALADACARQRARLGARQVELLRIEEPDGAGGDRSRERRGRRRAAQDDDAHVRGERCQRRRQQGVERGVLREILEVVEDDDRAGGDPRAHELEEAAGVRGEPERVLRPEQRERLAAPAREPAHGLALVVEEGRGIGVARVELVPEAGSPARREPARRERGLPAARRRVHPDDGVAAHELVEPPEEPRAGGDGAKGGARDLRGRSWHPPEGRGMCSRRLPSFGGSR